MPENTDLMTIVESRCKGPAPKARAISSSARSRVAVASATVAKTSGKHATTTVASTVPDVEPNQIMASTIYAIGGTPMMIVKSGRASRIAAAE